MPQNGSYHNIHNTTPGSYLIRISTIPWAQSPRSHTLTEISDPVTALILKLLWCTSHRIRWMPRNWISKPTSRLFCITCGPDSLVLASIMLSSGSLLPLTIFQVLRIRLIASKIHIQIQRSSGTLVNQMWSQTTHKSMYSISYLSHNWRGISIQGVILRTTPVHLYWPVLNVRI